MKSFAFALVCSLACMACARPLQTLSDGQPGYAVNCDTVRERCLKEISLICQGKSYYIISERAQEHRPPLGWTDSGSLLPKFNSRYWMEVRCDPSF